MTIHSDAIRRGIRTFIQAVPAGVIVGALVAFGWLDPDPKKVGSLTIILTGTFSALMNALEDSGAIPAVLKTAPSSGTDPVPTPQTPAPGA